MGVLKFISDYHLGDLASVAGVIISVVGFVVTVINVWRSKSAAERAENAANEARRVIRAYQTISDFAAAISLMEEIKVLHRSPQIDMLLDRYSSLRKTLIGVNRISSSLGDDASSKIQNAIATLASMEDLLEETKATGQQPDFARLNRLLARDIDTLHGVLVDMKLADERRA
jgi:GTP1/Obg family GTP-binding protein